MYGIGAVKYKGQKVGYIAKNSFDMGGSKPESADIGKSTADSEFAKGGGIFL